MGLGLGFRERLQSDFFLGTRRVKIVVGTMEFTYFALLGTNPISCIYPKTVAYSLADLSQSALKPKNRPKSPSLSSGLVSQREIEVLHENWTGWTLVRLDALTKLDWCVKRF